MKRIATLGAVAVLVAVPVTSEAAPKRIERTVNYSYTGFCDAGVDGLHGGPVNCPNPAEARELVQKGETHVKFTATDGTGGKIGLRFYNVADFAGTVQSFCGESGKTQKVKAGQEMAFRVSLDPTCGAVPTTGTIAIVFSNMA